MVIMSVLILGPILFALLTMVWRNVVCVLVSQPRFKNDLGPASFACIKVFVSFDRLV